jgi:hypothetical protein
VLARWWIGLAALYLLLAWSVAPPDLAVAAVAATVRTAGAALVGARARLPLRGLPRQLLGLFTDLVTLARALPARRGGRLERAPSVDPALGSLASLAATCGRRPTRRASTSMSSSSTPSRTAHTCLSSRPPPPRSRGACSTSGR